MKKHLLTAAVCAALFLLLILLVRTVDVAAIGPQGTEIGLSAVNGAVHEAVDYREGWYRLSAGLGYAALALAAFFALLGLKQLVQRKSLFKVDRELLVLAGLYAAVLVLYVLFDKVAVNYRPMLLPGDTEPEASFPSTHTMLACVLYGSASMLAGRYVRGDGLRIGLRLLAGLLLILTVLGRMLSGVHWLTDILGGLLISTTLLALFAAALAAFADGRKLDRRRPDKPGKHLAN